MIDSSIYQKSLLIREFEKLLLKLFSQGKLNGTVHTCVGQEIIPTLLMKYIKKDDTFFSNHRGHGHYIAKTGDVKGLLAEIMGKKAGCSGGYGGSQHLFYENEFYSNGIQGGMTPIAVGHSFSKVMRGKEGISVVFIGDGTLGEGILYEAMNLASINKCPVLFVLENNKYAQSTSHQQTFRGSTQKRFEGFGLKYLKSNIWEAELLEDAFKEAVDVVRKFQPCVVEVDCYRLNSHSKGDDNREDREIEEYHEKDPLYYYEKAYPEQAKLYKDEIDSTLQQILNVVEAGPDFEQRITNESIINIEVNEEILAPQDLSTRVNEVIYQSLAEYFNEDKDVIMLGEDIEHNNNFTPKPYGGAFKVTKNLSDLFKGRVFNTPISEAGITGFAIGMALQGRKSIVEIMFGDFMTLTLDQILQHASKFCTIFGVALRLPIVIRTPMGGKRGYGPTHSQSIEKHFIGIPNLEIIALNYRVNIHNVYKSILANVESPTIIIENKTDYSRYINAKRIETHDYYTLNDKFPTVKISPKQLKPSITIFTYGGNLADVEQAAEELFLEHEIGVEIICPTLIQPVNLYPVTQSLKITKKLLTIEEGTSFAALGSEIIAQLYTSKLNFEVVGRVGNNNIIPSSYKGEMNLLPTKQSIIQAIIN